MGGAAQGGEMCPHPSKQEWLRQDDTRHRGDEERACFRRPAHSHCKSGQTPSTALRSPPPALPPSCAATQASVADAAVQAHLAVTEAASGIGVVALREIAIRRVEDEVDLAAFGVDTFATRVKKPCAAGGEREAGRRSSSVRSTRSTSGSS